MYLDPSRVKDLEELHSDMHDTSKPMWERKLAYRAFQDIMKQLKDKKLSALRERLVKATDANDRYEAWKIKNQIKDYMGEEMFNDRAY